MGHRVVTVGYITVNFLSKYELIPNNFFSDFSLSEWADRVGTDISGQLEPEFRQLLLEQLGLDVKLKSPPCNRSDDMYGPAVNGWNNGMLSSILKYNLLGIVYRY